MENDDVINELQSPIGNIITSIDPASPMIGALKPNTLMKVSGFTNVKSADVNDCDEASNATMANHSNVIPFQAQSSFMSLNDIESPNNPSIVLDGSNIDNNLAQDSTSFIPEELSKVDILNEFSAIDMSDDEDYENEYLSTDNDASINNVHLARKKVNAMELHRRLKKLISNPLISHHAKALRLGEAIEEILMTSWIRCRHIAMIIKYFRQRYGDTQRTLYFGSYAVDVVVTLFHRIVDIHNFELVLGMMDARECAALLCRLGFLTLFNPMKPENCIEMSMSRAGERLLAKMYVVLSVQEPGINLVYQSFQWKRGQEPGKLFIIPLFLIFDYLVYTYQL
jgi:hypothetical protein